MTEKIRLLNLLEKVLGKSKKSGSSNYSFYCPKCNHYKRKLEVNLDNYNYHCWICDKELSGTSIFTLFKKLNIDEEYYTELKHIINGYASSNPNTKNRYNTILTLPMNMKYFSDEDNSVEYKNALKYLKNDRGLTFDDIIKYNIGYCTEGKYKNMVIIPSYSKNGDLNYYFGRTYYESDFNMLNPKADKNIIGFELFINWDYPIVLCEGVLDAIAIKRNAIPLYGKTVLEKLKIKILRSNLKDIYIALDPDALKKSIEIAEFFIVNGKNVFIVNLDNKDPSKHGFIEMQKRIKESNHLTFKEIINLKLSS